MISGGAAFTVSGSATDGEHISMFGHHANSGTGVTSTSRLTLTIDAAQGRPRGRADGDRVAAGQRHQLRRRGDQQRPGRGDVGDDHHAAVDAGDVDHLVDLHVSATTHQASCPIGALASGATTHARFTANFGLLSLGALNATATRTASAPNDPNAANDRATANCTAVTSLLITC